MAAVGPRLGFAYALDNKTTIRGAATRSYGPVINPLGSTHYLGFVQQIVASDTSQGLNPLFTLAGWRALLGAGAEHRSLGRQRQHQCPLLQRKNRDPRLG